MLALRRQWHYVPGAQPFTLGYKANYIPTVTKFLKQATRTVKPVLGQGFSNLRGGGRGEALCLAHCRSSAPQPLPAKHSSLVPRSSYT